MAVVTSPAIRLAARRHQRRSTLSIPRLGLAGVLAVLTVLAQICYPLTSGTTLNALAVITVLIFAATSLTQVAETQGVRKCLRLLLIAGTLGFGAEALGVHTGFPFGHYAYTRTLGPELLAVPLVIPLAWVMMAWPALCVGRRIGHPLIGGALALATWDLFLDPQMVHDGHWIWQSSGPRLTGIPITNYLGWGAVAVMVITVLDRALPATPRPNDTVPLGLWLWTWASSILANLAFFHRPLVALVGGVAMAVVGVPLVRALRHRS